MIAISGRNQSPFRDNAGIIHEPFGFMGTRRGRPTSLIIFLLSIYVFNSLVHGQDTEPQSAGEFQRRGVEHFEQGRFMEAIRDFDKVIELEPRMAARHWQRGIAYYYAKQFQKGVEQFELHQTVNSQDVENAVWHFICKVRVDGFEAAQKAFIPIEYDSRVPMKEIWDLFAGTATPEDVLTAARRPSPYKRQQLCYAHLYLGLYYEAVEKHDLARHHIHLAATDFSMNNYMGMVARVHAELLEK